LQGLRHAFEPDHVVAISTMLGEQKTTRARLSYAASWGLGHASMLVLVGAILVVLRAELPPRVDAAFELAVSLMLILLGARAVKHAVHRASRDADHVHASDHDHLHVFENARSPGKTGPIAVRPLAMGIVHGLAGSGALTALVVARLPSPVVAIAFMVLFGAGATIGMSLLAGVAGAPLARLLRTRWGLPALLGATGSLSLVLGLSCVVPAAMRLTV
jgi:high-affinity nickel-transport protein